MLTISDISLSQTRYWYINKTDT